MSILKTMAEMIGDKQTLRSYLHRKMPGHEEARNPLVIHASDLTRTEEAYCPRERALYLWHGQNMPGRYIGTALRYTFDLGEGLHDLLRDTWAKDIAVGDWECFHCHQGYFLTTRPHVCHKCSSTSFVYKEVRMESQISHASGGIDLMVRLPGKPKLSIVECKSIISTSQGSPDFKGLKGTLFEHELRTNMYLRLVDESDSPLRDYIDTQEAIVFYMIKGYGAKDPSLADEGVNDTMTPFKEYTVKRDDAATEPYLAKAREMWVFLTEGVVPTGVCPEYKCKRAAKCGMKDICFGGSFPPGSKTDFAERVK